MHQSLQTGSSQLPTLSPPRLTRAQEIDHASVFPVIHSKAEPLFHRLLRKLRTSDFCFSAMVSAFKKLQDLGISIGPNHFYWPVPDLHSLDHSPSKAEILNQGLDLRLPRQLEFLTQVSEPYQGEWTFPDKPGSRRYHYNNGFFETVDAEIAYSIVRSFKPARIIEVGGGYSTRLLIEAARANREQDGVKAELITIDPCLDRLHEGSLNGDVHILQRPVQQVDLDLFSSLQGGDILFLDSSHVVSVGSDVVYEYLGVLPRLNKGVLVHAHDIFVPFDYPRDLVDNLSFWSEQYLLTAFLRFNSCFEVLWSSSAMQGFHREVLERTFPRWKGSYEKLPKEVRRFVPRCGHDRIWPSSFWMRRTC
jgi:hypothetical protein